MNGFDLIEKRNSQMSNNVSIFYKESGGLIATKGEGCYLIDNNNNRYLDTCNNVACVGHSNPIVVNAGIKGISEIQTNQRFLHPIQQQYISKLLATFPAELNTIYLVNSGSEANDLALRIARSHNTALLSNDVIVLDGAYHGNTSEMIKLSPYKWSQAIDGRNYKGDNIHVVSLPDTSPIAKHKGFTIDSASKYAKEVEDIIQAKGGIGVFIAESAMGCAGQVILPPTYLKQVYTYIRATGGVCIADEVQTGFARSGESFWMFQQQDVIPDIVTIGKPMGNGYPVAAVVCKRQIADSFAKSGIEYFNTYGGNSVACYIAEAVLDVIIKDNLLQKCQDTGLYLRLELEKLMIKYKQYIGEIRGIGLFYGIVFIKLINNENNVNSNNINNKINYIYDNDLAKFIVDYLYLELKIISSRDANVIKIKPPLVFSKIEVDLLVNGIDIALFVYSNL